MKVLELMKVHVIKAGAEATLGDAVDMMDLYQISTLPIVDEQDRLIGVISESDIVRSVLPPFLDTAGSLGRGTEIHSRMSTDVVSVDEGADVVEAARIMLKRDLKRLPVTSDGRLVGTI